MIASGNSTQLIFNKECYPNYHVSLSNMEEEWFVFKVPLFLSGVHLVSFPTHTEQPHHLDPAPHNNDDRFLINGGYCSSISNILYSTLPDIRLNLTSVCHSFILYLKRQSHTQDWGSLSIHPLPKWIVSHKIGVLYSFIRYLKGQSHTTLGFFFHSSST